jgi:hypothetical protein
MSRAIAIGACVVWIGSASILAAPAQLKLQDLTLAKEHLPGGCSLADSPSLKLDQNPWVGNDPRVLAQIRTRMYGLSTVAPDGPPLNRQETSRFSLSMAEGLDEGYAAFYQDAGPEGIAVYALRFRTGERPVDHSTPRGPKDRTVSWSTVGQTVVLVVGDTGRCAEAIQANVTSLAKAD